MPSLDETSPHLVAHLRTLMDEYGARGVYNTCARLINAMTPPDAGNGHSDTLMPVPSNYTPEHFAAATGLPVPPVIDTAREYSDDTPAPGSTLGLVSDAPDATPMQWPPVTVHNDPPGLRDPDAWDNWKHAHGVAHGDPNNVGPMGTR